MSDQIRPSIYLASLLVLCGASSIRGQGTSEPLWTGGSADTLPTLTSFAVSGTKNNGAAVLICPGGGYDHLADIKEGTAVAKKFNGYGISAFVVKYRHSPDKYPIPFDDARRAMRMIRARAQRLGIDTNRIGIMGFSAGGHLASTVVVHSDSGNKAAKDTVDRMSCKPSFAILIYPVISMKSATTHAGSKTSLLGANPDTALVTYLSNELHVTQSTPPSFLVHGVDDAAVKIANSQLYYDACVKAKVTAKFVKYASGPHGFGLADGQGTGNAKAPDLPAVAGWPDSCAKWLETNGFFSATTAMSRANPAAKAGRSVRSFQNGRIWMAAGEKDAIIARDFSGKAIGKTGASRRPQP